MTITASLSEGINIKIVYTMASRMVNIRSPNSATFQAKAAITTSTQKITLKLSKLPVKVSLFI